MCMELVLTARIRNRYLRALGAFYLRLVGTAMEIYQYLEPLLNDYRKLRRKSEGMYCWNPLFFCIFFYYLLTSTITFGYPSRRRHCPHG